jgi:hypothetical protein
MMAAGEVGLRLRSALGRSRSIALATCFFLLVEQGVRSKQSQHFAIDPQHPAKTDLKSIPTGQEP